MIERYAAVVCDWSLEVGPGTRLLVDGGLEAKALATAVAAHAWRAGATVSVNLYPSWASGAGLSSELEGSFDAVCEIVEAGPGFTGEVAPIPGVRCLWPTARGAQREGVGTLRLAETVFSRCLLDRPDPIAAWREVALRNERAIARLGTAGRLTVGEAAFAIGNARWKSEAGRTRLPGACVEAVLGDGRLTLATDGCEVVVSLDCRPLAGPVALDGVEVTGW